jgi:hypothetical protein
MWRNVAASNSHGVRACLVVATLASVCLVTPTSASAATCATNFVIAPIPIDKQLDYEEFLDVDVLGSSSAWAVGQTAITGPAYDSALAMRWNGGSWTRIPVPAYGDDGAKLFGVSAISDTDVWATGYTESLHGRIYDRPLAIRWNGSRWRRFAVPLPPDGGGGAELRRAFALANDDVWAVGWYHTNRSGLQKTLIEHWDGAAWSVVPSPNVHGKANVLFGVTATSTDAAWAVGRTGNNQMLIERWNGSRWSIESIQGRARGWLNDIDASPSGRVFAVGKVTRPSSYHAVVLARSNSGWGRMDVPHVRASILSGVAWTTTRAYAVGNGRDGPVVYKWTGSAWVKRTVAYYANGYPDLNAVGAATDGSAWTVGLRITKPGEIRSAAETICR